MKIPFNTPARKWLVASIAAALAIVYVGLAASQYIAFRLGTRVELKSGSSVELARLEKAAWLDPSNADYRNAQGHYYDLVAQDPAAAAARYRTAVELNPHSADYWFDLASAYQILGDTASQTAALEHAIRAEPTRPDVAWTAANFYLVRGENEQDRTTAQALLTIALREFRVVIANEPSLVDDALKLCWHTEPDVDLLLRDVIPPTGGAYMGLLTLLQNDTDRLLREVSASHADTDAASLTQPQSKVAQIENETAATFKVWDALIQSRQPFDERHAYDYIQFLIQPKIEEVDQAVLVWQQTADRFAHSSYLPSPSNLIVNGTFSLPLLDAGFDWQYRKKYGVNLTLDHLDPKDPRGPRSLMISFDGPGIVDAGIYQLVALQPNSSYEFSAHYKNDGEQEGAGAPHFTIRDMYSQVVYYQSDELRASDELKEDDELQDSKSWKSVRGEFTTSADCKLVMLYIRRLPEGSPIRAKLWVDDFHLTRKPY